jgi:ArsR family transcriptional regulator, arsenate/arsenite/antimonite-responsive transcriptional repressor
MKTATDTKLIEKVANALSDKSRLCIVQEIAKRGSLLLADALEMTDLSQPCISHHVKILTESDLVIAEKEGRSVRLHLNKSKLKEVSQFLIDLL